MSAAIYGAPEFPDSVVNLVESSSFFLVEKMAREIAKVCLEYRGVEAVKVLVEKPTALRFARSVGVEIFRDRSSYGREP